MERSGVKARLSLAERVGPEAVQIVRQAGGWPEPAKVTLINSGSRCAAKWLNRSGVSADYADELALLGAVGSILAGNRIVEGALQKLIAEKEAARKRQAQSAGAPAPIPPLSDSMIHGRPAN